MGTLNHCQWERSLGCQQHGRKGRPGCLGSVQAGGGCRWGADVVQAELSRVQARCRVQEGSVGAGGVPARCRQG